MEKDLKVFTHLLGKNWRWIGESCRTHL